MAVRYQPRNEVRSMHIEQPLDQLELLYRRLGFQVQADAHSLTVQKASAGFAQDYTFFHLAAPDDDSILELARSIEESQLDAQHAIVIASADLTQEARALLADHALGPFTLAEWLNRLLRTQDTCTAIASHSPSEQFISPQLTPIEIADLEQWAHSDKPGESLGHVVLLLGPPGFGKTTIARHIARRAAEEHLQAPSNPVPLLISLEDFRSEGRWDHLLAAYSRKHGMPEITPEALKFFIDHGRAFLIVDGLDELAERGGTDAATETLRELCRITSTGKLLITARDAYLPDFQRALSPDMASFVQVRGISKEGRLQLLSDATEAVREQTLTIIDSAEDRGSYLSTNPLFLTTLASVIADTQDGPAAPIKGRSQVRLLSDVMLRIHYREARRQEVGITADEYQELLGRFAVDALKRGVASKHEDNLTIPDGLGYLRLFCEDRAQNSRNSADVAQQTLLARRILSSLRSHPALQPPRARHGDELEFRHPFYRNALAASYCAQDPEYTVANVSPLEVGDSVTVFVSELLSDSNQEQRLTTQGREAPGFPFLIAGEILRKTRMSEGASLQSSAILQNWSNTNLAGIAIRGVHFAAADFSQSNLSRTHFTSCSFTQCSLQAAVLSGAQFEKCLGDSTSIAHLRSHGIIDLPLLLELTKEGPSVSRTSAEAFAFEAISKFFSRFVRSERGRHQRSTHAASFVRGLSPTEAEFAKEHVVPAMRKQGIVEEVFHIRVYKFNSTYQPSADAIIFDHQIHDDIRALYQDLIMQAQRFLRTTDS